eukprot:7916400-Alexandrium_andersonii.AAC.1
MCVRVHPRALACDSGRPCALLARLAIVPTFAKAFGLRAGARVRFCVPCGSGAASVLIAGFACLLICSRLFLSRAAASCSKKKRVARTLLYGRMLAVPEDDSIRWH